MSFDKNTLLSIGLKKRNKQIELTWNEINSQYADNFFTSGEDVRMWVKNQLRNKKNEKIVQNEIGETKINFNESVEINKDGSQTSNKLIKMSLEDTKNPEFLLKAHGYNTEFWELVSARSNIWNAYSKQDGIMQLYSSRIVVKPLKNGNSIEKIIKAIEKIRPVYIEVESFIADDKSLLEIPLFDQHFGISDYEYYKRTQSDIYNQITKKKWTEILFIIGQDLFHNNDFKGHTANGTQIEVVDMEKTWDDCCKFYEPLISQAIKNSEKVKVIYSKGNHDETISFGFVKYLKAKFPQVEFDDRFAERKIHTFEKIFIGITHGDKYNLKDLANVFIKDFPLEWANAKVREIHKGHFHIEDGKDIIGTMVRTLATRNKTDKWHDENNYIGANKRFMLFEYSADELKSIYYV